MARVFFAPRLRPVAPPDGFTVPGATVRAVLEAAFRVAPLLRAYVLDEHGALRGELALFIDGATLDSGAGLDRPLGASSQLDVLDA